MTFEEYIKIAQTGDRVWICDYRKESLLQKPIRHVKPTYVEVCDNGTTDKPVYYSPIHFRPVGQSGAPLKRVIPPYDNTGYRGFKGTALHIFITEEDAIEHYNNRCDSIIEDMRESLEQAVADVEEEMESIRQQKIEEGAR
jgi:hypothetical protein